MKKVLILGIDGMLGNMVFFYLKKNNDFICFGTTRNKKTLSKFKNVYYLNLNSNYINKIENILDKNKFSYVINCFSQNHISSIENGLIINSYIPNILNQLSVIYNYKLIHFSTNGIFSGDKGNYSIFNIPDSLDIYGLSKYLGEIDSNNNLTIRTSIIGIEMNNNKNLLNWFLSQKNNSNIDGYDKVFWNGFTTLTIAKIVDYIISKNVKISGIIQLGGKSISKYELLKIFNTIFNKNINIKKDISIFSDKTIKPSKEQNKFKHLIFPIDIQINELKYFYNL